MFGRSPLKQPPLRNRGESLDDELSRLREDSGLGYIIFTTGLVSLAVFEWHGYFFNTPRQSVLFTCLAVACFGATLLYFRRVKKRAAAIRLGRDGERLVGQSLDALRAMGASIFHDIPGEGFSLDHVVISDRGVVVVETKTWTKPAPDSKITFEGEQLLAAGRRPSRDPIRQVRAESAWLSNLLEQLTGEILPVRGALVVPGWSCDRAPDSIHHEVWVLEPKALPALIEHESVRMSADQIARATLYLSEYIRQRSGAGK